MRTLTIFIVSLFVSFNLYSSPMNDLIDFDNNQAKQETGYYVAYLTECVNNPYCEARLAGMEAAAEKYGFKFKLFDANFNPATQYEHVQTAVTLNFDGYVYMPAAEAPGCAGFKLLQSSGKPVANGNSPMCGNKQFTEGTISFVAFQTQEYFTNIVRDAFKDCKTECKAIAVGGFVGSDLFTRWENAIEIANKEYPNVNVVVNQEGRFDPRVAHDVVSTGLTAHPDTSIILCSWDDMTRGCESGALAVGADLGGSVKIYSVGGTILALEKLKAGLWEKSTVLLPFEEAYYTSVALMRYLLTGEATPGWSNLGETPTVTNGPGTIFISKDNADKLKPNY